MTRPVSKVHVHQVDRTLIYPMSACTQHAASAGYGLQSVVPPNNYLRSFNYMVMMFDETIDLIRHWWRYM